MRALPPLSIDFFAPDIPDVATTPSSYLSGREAVAFESEARKQAFHPGAWAERNAVKDARDDTLVRATVACVGPAAAILAYAWAYATGLLDSGGPPNPGDGPMARLCCCR